jgi:hypothetical protein
MATLHRTIGILFTPHEISTSPGFHEGRCVVLAHECTLRGESFYRHVASHRSRCSEHDRHDHRRGLRVSSETRVGFSRPRTRGSLEFCPGSVGLFAIRDSHAPYLTLTPKVLPARCWAAVEANRRSSHGTADRCRSHVHFDRLPHFDSAFRMLANLLKGVEDVAADIFLRRRPLRVHGTELKGRGQRVGLSPRSPRAPDAPAWGALEVFDQSWAASPCRRTAPDGRR